MFPFISCCLLLDHGGVTGFFLSLRYCVLAVLHGWQGVSLLRRWRRYAANVPHSEVIFLPIYIHPHLSRGSSYTYTEGRKQIPIEAPFLGVLWGVQGWGRRGKTPNPAKMSPAQTGNDPIKLYSKGALNGCRNCTLSTIPEGTYNV